MKLTTLGIIILNFCVFNRVSAEECKVCDTYETVQLFVSGDLGSKMELVGNRKGMQDFGHWLGDRWSSNIKIDRVVDERVTKASELEEVFKRLAGQCVKVKVFTLMGHGNEKTGLSLGTVSLNFENGDPFKRIAKYNCVMAPQAAVVLPSCHTGAGCSGDFFEIAIARALLPKGGKVVSSEDYVMAASIISPRSFPVMGNYKTLEVLPNFSGAAFGPAPSGSCRSEAEKILIDTQELRRSIQEVEKNARQETCDYAANGARNFIGMLDKQISECRKFLSGDFKALWERKVPITENELKVFEEGTRANFNCQEATMSASDTLFLTENTILSGLVKSVAKGCEIKNAFKNNSNPRVR